MKSLLIIGRRWFERTNGNTYFSATGYVDGVEKARIDYEYGYGNQYEWSMWEKLIKDCGVGPVEHYQNGAFEGPRYWCNRNGVAYATEVTDVARKRDL